MKRPEFSLEQHEQVFGFWTEARTTYDAAEDKDAGYEVLRTVPGVDPVLAVVDGHPEDIPAEGWLIASHIAPGYGGVVRVTQYGDGALVPRSVSDIREQYGQARVHFDLNGYGEHTVAYENPAFPHRDVEPYARMSQASYTGLSFSNTDIIELENGGRILDERAPLRVHGGSSFFALDWEDIDRRTDLSREIDIARVVNNPELVRKVLAQLGYAMGMTKQGLETLVDVVDKKINPTS